MLEYTVRVTYKRLYSYHHQGSNTPINDPFSLSELMQIITSLKPNSSPGPDGITYSMIKHLPQESVDHLLKIYNFIWTNRSYPRQWKKSLVIPILKQNSNKTDPKNYRPISLSNCLSKVLQKMVNQRLLWFLESNELLNKHQSGFRQGRSTTEQIINLESEIQTAFRYKQHLIAIFLDIEKAYDTVWKYNILSSMKEFGLEGNILHFAQNFLSNREFRVKTNDCISEPKVQENGVPQGEIFSVTLFLIAINKITRNMPKQINISLFADDLVLYMKGKNVNTLQRNLQIGISRLETWSQITGFKFSNTKTKAIHFCKLRKAHNNPNIRLNNINIEFVSTIRFLGVIFDKTLSWADHIQKIKTECSHRINILKSLSHHKWGAHRASLLNII